MLCTVLCTICDNANTLNAGLGMSDQGTVTDLD